MEFTNSLLEFTLTTYIVQGDILCDIKFPQADEALLHGAWSTGRILFRLAFKMSLYYCNYQNQGRCGCKNRASERNY